MQSPRDAQTVLLAERARRVALVVALGMLFSVVAEPDVVAGDPTAGEWFEYEFDTFLTQGTGEYEGYSETMKSRSRYDVVDVASNLVTMDGAGTWSWSASDGSADSGTFSTYFTFSSASRRYVTGIDVEGSYADPAVWFWVSPNLAVGNPVRILDDIFTVISVDEAVQVGGQVRAAMRLVTSGSYTRDDVYGRFDATYTDTYDFDRATGYVLAERYQESDVNATASFLWTAEVTVLSASFAPAAGAPAAPSSLLPVLAALGAVMVTFVGILLVVWRVQRGPSAFTVSTSAGPVDVRIRRARRPQDLDGLVPEASPVFGPLLTSFARHALRTNDPVVLAIAGPRMVGLITQDAESGLGSLFATDGEIGRSLVRRLRVDDFFSEAQASGWNLPAQPVDSFAILERRDLQPMPYDPQVVRPMLPTDLPSVIGIAEEVYRGRASRWVESCFRDGDIAYVATAGGRVVGFGFANLADHVGRLHTLTVLAAYRGRGLGTELTAARLSALSSLGVERVLVEISQRNSASLRIAERAGFQRVGETVYYSRVPRSSAIAFQRQF